MLKGQYGKTRYIWSTHRRITQGGPHKLYWAKHTAERAGYEETRGRKFYVFEIVLTGKVWVCETTNLRSVKEFE